VLRVPPSKARKAKYAGLEVDQVRQMAQLQEENLRLKQLVAERTLDSTFTGRARKKWLCLRGVHRWWSIWNRCSV